MAERRTKIMNMDTNSNKKLQMFKLEWDPVDAPTYEPSADEAMVPPDPMPPAPEAPNFVYELVETVDSTETVIARGANLAAMNARAARWIEDHMG